MIPALSEQFQAFVDLFRQSFSKTEMSLFVSLILYGQPSTVSHVLGAALDDPPGIFTATVTPPTNYRETILSLCSQNAVKDWF